MAIAWQRQIYINTVLNIIAALAIVGVGVFYLKLIETVNMVYPAGLIVVGSLIFIMAICGSIGITKRKTLAAVVYVVSLCLCIACSFVFVGLVFFHFKPAREDWYGFTDDLKNTIESVVGCCGFNSLSPNCTFTETCGDKVFGGLVSGSQLVAIIQMSITGLLFCNLIWLFVIMKRIPKN